VACAERLIPYSLELGGKDPAVVLADADLDRAANGIAWGGMFNSGQVCVSVERVYVEEPVYDEFVAKLTDKVSRLRQGQDDARYRFDVGAMATAAQRDIVRRHVEEAVAAGRAGDNWRSANWDGHLLSTDCARRYRSVDVVHDRGDIRPDLAGGQSGGRGRGDPTRQ
jgi:acyl-CoA reductase-like NAD-dependent aldehyde dehydrogenase